ncbi:MAG: DUF1778 domain-containing protein [Methylocystis sp.]
MYANVIQMREQPLSSSVLSVRVSPGERALLEEAAAQAHMSLSEFLRRRSIEAAEAEVLNRSNITIPAKDWEAFEAWVGRPAEAVPALAELARRTPSWKR